MITKRKRILGWLCPVLFLALVLWGSNSSQAQEIGKLIDKSNWQEYKSWLSPYELKGVQNGELAFQTGKLNYNYKLTDRFLSVSEKNAGKYDVDKTGNIIEKATGKFGGTLVYGLPFPKIDPKDPGAGAKIMWNLKFMQFRFMGRDGYDTMIRWVARSGKEDRYFVSSTYDLYYLGRPPGQEIKNNPDGFLYQSMTSIQEPMDLKNTNFVSWEYQDLRDTTVYNYIPVMRRVRRSSGATRSDPYMGSDSWNDSKDGFSGKNTAFTWKLIGEGTCINGIDSLDKHIWKEEADGSVWESYSRKYGYETPGWKGAPWAFTSLYWIPRPCWIVEGMPTDPYYAWGKHVMWIDKEVFHLINKEIYDKAGEFQHWHVFANGYGETPSGNNTAGDFHSMIALDTKADHGSAIYWKTGLVNMPTTRRGPSFFTVANFLQMSK